MSIEVPSGFVASDTDRGVQVKTPDAEVFVWVETYQPADEAALVEEHEAYWAEEGVALGTPDKTTETSGGTQVSATSFKSATWKGDPTVVRYLFIDGNFPSKEKILMSIWASPEGFKEHNAAIGKIVDSIEAK